MSKHVESTSDPAAEIREQETHPVQCGNAEKANDQALVIKIWKISDLKGHKKGNEKKNPEFAEIPDVALFVLSQPSADDEKQEEWSDQIEIREIDGRDKLQRDTKNDCPHERFLYISEENWRYCAINEQYVDIPNKR